MTDFFLYNSRKYKNMGNVNIKYHSLIARLNEYYVISRAEIPTWLNQFWPSSNL
jgi:hypothetical protein